MVDFDTSSKLRDYLNRAHSAIPKMIDQANDSGDYSQIPRANSVMDRLSSLADHHAQMIGEAQQQDQAGPQGQEGTPGVVGQDQSPATGPSRAGIMTGTSNLPPLDPQQLQGVQGPQGSAVHEAARGAVKGAAEAQPNIPGYLPPRDLTEKDWQEGDQLRDSEASVKGMIQDKQANNQAPADDQTGDGPTPDTVMKVAPLAERAFQGNPQAFMADVAKVGGSSMDRQQQEFFQRVQQELGARPKSFTIPKVFAALALGASSMVGAWLSRRYDGQALVDLNADQKHWDAERAQIGRETYLANKGIERAGVSQEGANERSDARNAAGVTKTLVTEGNKDARQDKGIQAKKDMQGVAEAGKNARLQKALDQKAFFAKSAEKLSPHDKLQFETLHQKAGELFKAAHDPMTPPSKQAALQNELDQVQSQIDEVIGHYKK